MAVGTGAISLTEIIAEIPGTQTSLQDCVNDANGSGLNGTYYTVPLDSVADFRGYTEPVGGTNTLKVTPTTFSTSAGATSFSLTMTSNASWSISDSATWITLSSTSGSGNASRTVTIAINNTGAPRSGSVTVQTTSGSPTISRICSINQSSGFE